MQVTKKSVTNYIIEHLNPRPAKSNHNGFDIGLGCF